MLVHNVEVVVMEFRTVLSLTLTYNIYDTYDTCSLPSRGLMTCLVKATLCNFFYLKISASKLQFLLKKSLKKLLKYLWIHVFFWSTNRSISYSLQMKLWGIQSVPKLYKWTELECMTSNCGAALLLLSSLTKAVQSLSKCDLKCMHSQFCVLKFFMNCPTVVHHPACVPACAGFLQWLEAGIAWEVQLETEIVVSTALCSQGLPHGHLPAHLHWFFKSSSHLFPPP